MRRRAFLAAIALASVSAFAQAPLDWSGYYAIANARELSAVGLKQMSVPQLNDFIVAHLRPWAKMKMETTNGVADDTGALCLPDGVFRYPNVGGRFLWLNAPGKILLVSWELNPTGVRRIYLNQQHPRKLLPTWGGHSVGRWEGEVLAVDSTGFNDKSWLMSNMQPHTEEVHMTERMRLVAGGKFLENAVVMEDRHALTSAYTFNRYYKRVDEEFTPNVCNEDPVPWKKFRNDALQRELDRARQVK